MKFIKTDQTPNGEIIHGGDDPDVLDNDIFWYARYIRLNRFDEFRITDNHATGSDRQLFIVGYIHGEAENSVGGHVIEVFERDEFAKAHARLKELIKELEELK